MPLTPLNLIEDAKLAAWPYLREENISPGSLLRHLTSLDREVVGLIAMQAPDRLSVAGSDIPIVLATNPTGYALNAAKAYTDFKYVDAEGLRHNIEIVPEGREATRHPAAYVLGSTFFPIDPLDRDWDSSVGERFFYPGDGDKVEYRYIAEPARLTTMSQTLASPDEAEPYLKESLTLQILLSCEHPVPQDRLQLVAQRLTMHRQNLQHEIIKKTGASARFGDER